MLAKQQAVIEWRDGQPYASAFQDVYFSTDNGLLETDYVFLQGNQLKNRWQSLNANTFTIAETGFGTGLNFLCAAKCWLETAPKEAKLHFVSVEKYPLGLLEITTALRLWPTLKTLSEPFLAQYERLLKGTSSIGMFDNRIQLSLLIGDATEAYQSNDIKHTSPVVDAWFLDGFAPAKNPDMWQTALFKHMALLSNANTTFATFTSAGAVRRGLTDAGFAVIKQSGFGKKREMLRGYFAGAKDDS
jgi:tRNA 5-methylaminomethyl-2-thiouridine biosynthesis bifunctional protein